MDIVFSCANMKHLFLHKEKAHWEGGSHIAQAHF